MSFDIFNILDSSLFNSFGSMMIVAICIVAFFLVVYLMLAVDFRFATIFIAPLIFGFYKSGWFGINGVWIVSLFWVVVVGFGLYLLWTWISDR